MPDAPDRTAARRAIEALRSGVPNGDAVRVLGCNQPAAEERFRERLASVTESVMASSPVPGVLVSGDFGTGKSHLLEYLEHVALSEGFVVSRIVISKETPLFDLGKMFRTAMETAKVPNRIGQAIQEIAVELRQDTPGYAQFYVWANRPESSLAAIFPASLLLHERLNNDPELIENIRNFWAGDRLPIQRVRDGLRQIGELAAFSLKAVAVRELQLQRFAFVSHLIRGRGYKGWVLLIDEVELVGRYSLMQRGRSYAELARWLGAIEGVSYPGILAVATITSDFGLAVLEQRADRDYVGARLRDKGTDAMIEMAGRAEAGMRIIEREAITLEPPTTETLEKTYKQLRAIHGVAYEWTPSEILLASVSVSRAMRSHVRRLINEWDLLRLYPGAGVETEIEDVKPGYDEDVTLEAPPEDDDPQHEDSDGDPIP